MSDIASSKEGSAGTRQPNPPAAVVCRRLRQGAIAGRTTRPHLETARQTLFRAGVIVAFNKPFGVLSQFTPEPGSQWRTLAEFGLPKGVYALGRLDADSEGLLLLSDEPGLNSRLLDPRHAHRREYWVQVEGVPGQPALEKLAEGVIIAGRKTLPCRARAIASPNMAPRVPPIRVRKSVPDSWISIELVEGKNRQVRRMTAAVGFPTLRLVRARIGDLTLASLALPPGHWRALTHDERKQVESCSPR
jgi:23S rRNA pseudouridine2457 synthase